MNSEAGRDPALLRSAPATRWTPAVFGIVPMGTRRRPSDIMRVARASLVIGLTALSAHQLTTLERRWFNLLAALPSWLRSTAGVVYEIGAVGTLVVLVLALAVTRRWRLAAVLSAAGIVAFVLATGLRALVDIDAARTTRGLTLDGGVPEYPVIALAVCTTVVLVALPFMARPARHAALILLSLATVGAVIDVIGLPEDVVASLALGWGVAALFHLATGTPAATPSVDQVAEALDALGVTITGLELAPRRARGTTHFSALAPDGDAISIEVIGRDASDARLFSKLWRLVWYRDSGPSLTLTRRQQLEHQAYVLLLARQAGVSVSEVVIAGIGGSRDTAMLVLREPDGEALDRTALDRVTDEVLDDTWANLERLHDARLAHGRMGTQNVRLLDDDTTAFVDFAHASSVAPRAHGLLDDVALLSTTATIVGTERTLVAAHRALGDTLPLLEPAALPSNLRKTPAGDKELLAELS